MSSRTCYRSQGPERGEHSLAFDDPPDDNLTQRFRTQLTSQVPEDFEISPLPSEILSWITQVLQIAASSLEAARKVATKTTTGPGDAGRGSARTPDTTPTCSSLCYPTTSGNSSQKPSSCVTATQIGPEAGTLQETVRNLWEHALCGKPQATWLRRFGAISNKAPCTSRAATTCDHS